MAFENKLINELEHLREAFNKTVDKNIKDIQRQHKIMLRSDKRQQKEYDQLQEKLNEVKALNKEIEETQKEAVFRMGVIGEARSKETANHVVRVSEYCYILAKAYGLSEKEADMLRQASPLHDIGKVAIPDAILNKPGRFTDDEREVMNTHAQLGYEMFANSQRPLLQTAATVAHEHHEKYDGSGYPRGLTGENIHIYGSGL